MKIHSFYLSLLCFFSLFLSCKTQQYEADKLPERQILFGSGGGFSGEITTYILLENGQIFKHSSLKNSMLQMGSVPKTQVKQLIKAVKSLALDKKAIHKPGNMSYFVAVKNGNTEHRSVWGDPNYQVDSTLENKYKKLIHAAQAAQAPIE